MSYHAQPSAAAHAAARTAAPAASSAASPATTVEDLISPTTLRQLVLNYLLHYSYVDTATAFARDLETTTATAGPSTPLGMHALDAPAAGSSSNKPTPAAAAAAPPELESIELDLLAVRKQVRDAILSGQIRLAIELINTHFPTVLNASPPPRTDAAADVAMNGTDSAGYPHRPGSTSVYGHLPSAADPGAEQSGSSAYNHPTLPDNPTSLDPAHLSLNLQIQDFIESVRNASPRGAAGTTTASSSRWSASAQQAMSSSIASLASTSSCASASTALSRATSPAPSSVSSSASGSASHQPFAAAAAAAAAAADLPGSSPLASPVHSSASQNGNHARSSSGTNGTGTGPASSSSATAGAATNGGSTSQLHRKATGKAAVRHHHAHFPPGSANNGTSRNSHSSSVSARLFTAIAHAQSLYRAVDALPSYWQALYRKELEKVTSLLAYTEVEGSPVKQLLHPNRRDALAEQINSAILFRTGRPSQPLIETAARQTTFVWKQLAADQIAVPAGHPLLAHMRNPVSAAAAAAAASGGTSVSTGSATAATSSGSGGYGFGASAGGAGGSTSVGNYNSAAGLNASLAALVHASHSALPASGAGAGGGGSGSKSDGRRGGGAAGGKETGKVLQPWNLEAFLNSR